MYFDFNSSNFKTIQKKLVVKLETYILAKKLLKII